MISCRSRLPNRSTGALCSRRRAPAHHRPSTVSPSDQPFSQKRGSHDNCSGDSFARGASFL